MLKRRDLPPGRRDFRRINLGQNEARMVIAIAKHLSPWIDNQSMAEGLPPPVASTLGRRKNIGPVFNGPGTKQCMPMRLSGNARKGGRDGKITCPGLGKGPVKMGKPQVIANGHPDITPWGFGQHGPIAGMVSI